MFFFSKQENDLIKRTAFSYNGITRAVLLKKWGKNLIANILVADIGQCSGEVA